MRKFQVFLITVIILFTASSIAAKATTNSSDNRACLVIDNYKLLSDLINNTPSYSNVSLEPNRSYIITQPIVLTKPISIDLKDSTITCMNSNNVFTIEADNVTIKNGVLDLNYTTQNGVIGSEQNNIVFENLVIKDLLPSATNYDGGIYLKRCTNIYIDNCTFKNILNYACPDLPIRSPAIKLTYCNKSTITKFHAKNCGVGVNSFDSKNITVSDFNMLNINNNGFYIQDDSKNISIKNGSINRAENGLVFKINNYTTRIVPTTVTCIGVKFSNISNKGISLRSGSGLNVSRCSFNEVGFAVANANDFTSCSNIIISENIIKSPNG